MLRALVLGLGAGALSIAAVACISHTDAPELGRVSGTVTSLDTRAPVEGARVLLINPATNTPSTPTTRTDALGHYSIDGVPAGWHCLVVYDDWQVLFDPIDDPLRVTGGGTVTRNPVIAVYPFLDPIVVRGRVIDAVSGAPVEGAYISVGLSDLAFLFSGTGFPFESISDQDGRFLLTGVPIARVDNRPAGLYPVLAARRGYLPGGTGSARRGEWIPLPANGDTVETVIRLEPGSGGRHVAGRLMHEGRPVAGVPVCLSLVDTATATAADLSAGADGADEVRARRRLSPMALVPDAATTSDAGGFFQIRNVPPGRYQVQAAYFPDDGWISRATIYKSDDQVSVGDADVAGVEIELLPSIVALSPRSGTTVNTGQPTLAWTSVPEVEFYRVVTGPPNSFLLNAYIETMDTVKTMPAGIWGDGDRARWAVYGYREGRIVAGTEVISSFQVNSR